MMRMIILLSFFSYSNKMILIILNCWYKVVWRLLVYPCGFSYTSLQMKAERPTGKTWRRIQRTKNLEVALPVSLCTLFSYSKSHIALPFLKHWNLLIQQHYRCNAANKCIEHWKPQWSKIYIAKTFHKNRKLQMDVLNVEHPTSRQTGFKFWKSCEGTLGWGYLYKRKT